MIDVRQGGPGEIQVTLEYERGKLTWTGSNYSTPEGMLLWLDPSRALDLANKLQDIVQAMDDAEREREP